MAIAGWVKAAGYEGVISEPTTYDQRILQSGHAPQALEDALRKAGPDLTRESLTATATATATDDFRFDADGAIGEVRFPEHHSIVVPCAAASIIRNRKFEPLLDGEVVCDDEDESEAGE